MMRLVPMTERVSSSPITKGIQKLARQIDSKSETKQVPVQPGEGCSPGSCFDNVRAVVRRHGGSTQHGWRMHELAGVYVEGEFHAVWRSPEGFLVDVTPRTDGLTTILFLPDSNAVWQGEDVPPRRLMLHEKPCYCGSGMPFKLCHGVGED
jgi:hypothetical protein